MIVETLSEKQRDILRFVRSRDYALICDGSVRSGKTVIMSMAFLIWAMANFNHTNFAICGKTVQSVERNVLKPMLEIEGLPFRLQYKVSTRILTVQCGQTTNWFYLFGGKDESSYMLIQGVTLAGVLFDEVALMPKSFVQQAMARAISYAGKKFFFNCNPESPNHWFYKDWIEQERRGVRHIHFALEDNPILTLEMIEQTKEMYTGVFYDRYILGLWVLAEGLIYGCFGQGNIVDELPGQGGEYYISCDYGTLNPFAALLWHWDGKKATCVREYYYSGRETNSNKTDEEYYAELEALAANVNIQYVIVDPSAASFIEVIRRHGKFKVRKAVNDVIPGITTTARYLQNGTIRAHRSCKNLIREFGLYRWDEKSTEDRPIKENDHAMDALRYFVMTALRRMAKNEEYSPLWMEG